MLGAGAADIWQPALGSPGALTVTDCCVRDEPSAACSPAGRRDFKLHTQPNTSWLSKGSAPRSDLHGGAQVVTRASH